MELHWIESMYESIVEGTKKVMALALTQFLSN